MPGQPTIAEVVAVNIYIIIVLLSYTVYIESLKTRGELARCSLCSQSWAGRPGARIFHYALVAFNCRRHNLGFFFMLIFPSACHPPPADTTTSSRPKQLFFTTQRMENASNVSNHLNATAVITAPKKTLNYIIIDWNRMVMLFDYRSSILATDRVSYNVLY